MLIKIDENLPAGVVQELKTLGHDADSSIEEGLGGCDDRTIWQSAQARGRLLITQNKLRVNLKVPNSVEKTCIRFLILCLAV